LKIFSPASKAVGSPRKAGSNSDSDYDDEGDSPRGGAYDEYGYGYGRHGGQRRYGSSLDDGRSCDDDLGGSFTLVGLRSLMRLTSLTSFGITTAYLFDNRRGYGYEDDEPAECNAPVSFTICSIRQRHSLHGVRIASSRASLQETICSNQY
jgi:hypothetical protein